MRSSSALIFCRRLVLTTLNAPFTEVHPVSLPLVHERGLGVLRGANGVGGAGALRTGGGCTGRLPQREKKWSTACPLRSQRIAMCAKGRPTSGGKCSTPPSPRGHCWREPFSKSPWRSIERPYFSTSSILKISTRVPFFSRSRTSIKGAGSLRSPAKTTHIPQICTASKIHPPTFSNDLRTFFFAKYRYQIRFPNICEFRGPKNRGSCTGAGRMRRFGSAPS